MAYEPTNWKTGDIVTAERLNKMEGGIASGRVLVATDTEGTLDKTWQEIHDAAFAVIKTIDGDIRQIIKCAVYESNYYLTCMYSNGGQYTEDDYRTNSANGYPVFD